MRTLYILISIPGSSGAPPVTSSARSFCLRSSYDLRYDTFEPSIRHRPSWMPEKWQKRSSPPSSGLMNPKPFSFQRSAMPVKRSPSPPPPPRGGERSPNTERHLKTKTRGPTREEAQEGNGRHGNNTAVKVSGDFSSKHHTSHVNHAQNGPPSPGAVLQRRWLRVPRRCFEGFVSTTSDINKCASVVTAYHGILQVKVLGLFAQTHGARRFSSPHISTPAGDSGYF